MSTESTKLVRGTGKKQITLRIPQSGGGERQRNCLLSLGGSAASSSNSLGELLDVRGITHQLFVSTISRCYNQGRSTDAIALHLSPHNHQ